MFELNPSYVGLVPIVLIVSSVLRKSKFVSALSSLGSIQRWSEARVKFQDNKAKRVSQVDLSDRETFTLSVMNVGVTSYLLGAYPVSFYLWYTPKAFLLIGLRWQSFFKKRKQHLLWDFCYCKLPRWLFSIGWK